MAESRDPYKLIIAGAQPTTSGAAVLNCPAEQREAKFVPADAVALCSTGQLGTAVPTWSVAMAHERWRPRRH